MLAPIAQLINSSTFKNGNRLLIFTLMKPK